MISAINSTQQLSSATRIQQVKGPSFQALSSKDIMDATQKKKLNPNFKWDKPFWIMTGAATAIGAIGTTFAIYGFENSIVQLMTFGGDITAVSLLLAKIAQIGHKHMNTPLKPRR